MLPHQQKNGSLLQGRLQLQQHGDHTCLGPEWYRSLPGHLAKIGIIQQESYQETKRKALAANVMNLHIKAIQKEDQGQN